MGLIRAYGEKEKEERRQQIIDIAGELFHELGYERTTFSEIGKRAHFTRINLYHYFKNKNDIFLERLLQDIAAMVQDADQTFAEPVTDRERFADEWTALMLRHERMIAIFSITNTVLLRGATDEEHEHFRQAMHESFQRLEAVVKRALPELGDRGAALFVEFENSYAMTLYPASVEYKKANGIAIFPHAGFGTRPFAGQFKPYLMTMLEGIFAIINK